MNDPTVTHFAHGGVHRLVGNSTWTNQIRQRVVQIAQNRFNVLLTGPTGTGKEVLARAIHSHSQRHSQPFVPVNCAAVPSSLFSSQLFGHVKGAFTGAQFASIGCFRAADGGTVFLDEIGELDLENQAKLLRVLQERRVTPVGSHEDHAVDVRTIAATNRDLPEEVRAGRFRLDLYYRLNVLTLQTTRLSERPADILPLANHFLAKSSVECGVALKSLTDSAVELLHEYDWPGNVRELENFIDRAVVLTEGIYLGPDAFPDILARRSQSQVAVVALDVMRPTESALPVQRSVENLADTQGAEIAFGSWTTLAELERAHILRTLEKTYYNQSAAARLLDVDRKLLARKLKKYGLQAGEVRDT